MESGRAIRYAVTALGADLVPFGNSLQFSHVPRLASLNYGR
jgi:hypothetical protein